jgi:hypothetical protein
MELVGGWTIRMTGRGDAERTGTEAWKQGEELREGRASRGKVLEDFRQGAFFSVAVFVVEVSAIGGGELEEFFLFFFIGS